MTITITTPRPPLNLFEVQRLSVTDQWQTLYEPPVYLIPADGPNPSRNVQTAAIMTNLAVTNPSTTNATIKVSVRVLSADNIPVTYMIINEMPVPANDFAVISLDRQVLKSGEQLQIKVDTSNTAIAHFSFILNQREEFTEVNT